MRVAIVTPFHGTPPQWLAQCHASVRAQTHACTHILVSDGDGANPLKDFEGQFIQLGRQHDDCGDTPRAIGSLSAASQGFDAIAWLDADNWLQPNHIETLLLLHQQTGAPVCTSARDIHHIDGHRLGRCPEVDGKHFVDTNCFLITRKAFALIGVWALMPAQYHLAGDLYFCATLRGNGFKLAHTGLPTAAYRATRTHTYELQGVTPPPGVRNSAEISRRLVAAGIHVIPAISGSRVPVIQI